MSPTPSRNASLLKQTPLHPLHVALRARMNAFSGFHMPINYPDGILFEHKHCRNGAALFDVSHMSQFLLSKPGCLPEVADALETLVPGNIRGLGQGHQCYTVLTNDAGGIIDDIMVSRDRNHFRLIGNASRCEADEYVLRDRLNSTISIELQDDALIALQGPKADLVLRRYAPKLPALRFMSGQALQIAGVYCWVSRSGYTGEDGYEISVPREKAVEIAETLLNEDDVEPAGLGARDSLRLEAGLCLYGNDLNEAITPVEAGLSWTIPKRRREKNNFPGSETILRQLKDGASCCRVGIKITGHTIARAGTKLFADSGESLGTVTSGGYGPSLGLPISVAYIVKMAAKTGQKLKLQVRNKNLDGVVTPLPFVEHRYHRN